jgi:hypothetical protein
MFLYVYNKYIINTVIKKYASANKVQNTSKNALNPIIKA